MRFRHLLTTMLCALLFSVTATASENGLIERTYAPFARLLERFVIEQRLEEGGLVTA